GGRASRSPRDGLVYLSNGSETTLRSARARRSHLGAEAARSDHPCGIALPRSLHSAAQSRPLLVSRGGVASRSMPPTYPSRADRVSLARTVFSYSRGRRTGRAIPHLQQAPGLVGECNFREPLAERGAELERVVSREERDRPFMPK